MLAPKQMSRLLIAASRDQLSTVITDLYRHHVFHIEDFVDQGAEGYEGFKIGTPLSGASESSTDLVKIRAIENVIAVNSDAVEPKATTSSRSELKGRIERDLPILEREVEALTNRRLKLDSQAKELEQKINDITPFVNVPVDLDLLRGYKGFSVYAGYVARDVNLTVPAEVYFAKGKDKSLIIVVTPAEHRSDVEKSLSDSAFQAITVPVESGIPKARIDEFSGKIAELKSEIDEIGVKLETIRLEHADFLVACEEVLKMQVEQTEAPLRFATTNETFVAEGWVPSDQVNAISDSLVKVTGGKIFVTVLPIDFEHDSVPVEYNNPSFAKPTQMLMDVYARPRYSEIDPTLMVSIVFPLFFGLILGDVGYGLILLVMAYGLRKFLKGEEGRQMLTVLRNASLSSIVFGFLFSEFLGFPIPGLSPILFSRHLMAEGGGHGPAIPQLMVMSIWIGILHITLGRVLGMVNHARQDHGEAPDKSSARKFRLACRDVGPDYCDLVHCRGTTDARFNGTPRHNPRN